jgi:hypothetical protein
MGLALSVGCIWYVCVVSLVSLVEYALEGRCGYIGRLEIFSWELSSIRGSSTSAMVAGLLPSS